MSDAQVVVTTAPFGAYDPEPLNRLRAAGIAYNLNPFGRKLQPGEVADVIGAHSVVIAGTEEISSDVIARCPMLKAICRVGVGLDSVDLIAARERGIAVAYTPEAPAPAVAELTIGLILDCLRGVSRADRGVRQGAWSRFSGRRLSEVAVGVVGVGRIGGRVLAHLAQGFPGVRLYAYDIDPGRRVLDLPRLSWVESLDALLEVCDVVSLHVPLSSAVRDLIDARRFARMKPGAVLINTARGGIINETDLAAALISGRLAAAAVDVFVDEPYRGPLAEIDAIVLTAHMGSMSQDCRAAMEIEATESALRFLQGRPFVTPVPEEEYRIAASSPRR